MQEIGIEINRGDVFTEVNKTTDYSGARREGSNGEERDRIVAERRVLETMERFWDEACSGLTERLKELVTGGSRTGDVYRPELEVSDSFDKALLPGVQGSIRSYFITSITGKWFGIVSKGDSQAQILQSEAFLEDARRQLYQRRGPRSPRRRG